MSTKEFYSCTWYDWSIWVERIHEMEDQRRVDRELLIEMVRSSLTQYYNWNRGSNPPLSPQDFWPLSYDLPRADNTEPSDEEKIRAITEIAEKVKRRRKRG